MAPMKISSPIQSVLDLQPIVFAFSLATGAALYFSLSFEPLKGVVLGFAVAVFACAFIAFKWSNSNLLNLVILAFLGVSGGISVSQMHAGAVESPKIDVVTGPVMIEGWVRAVEPGANGPRLLIDVHAIQRRSNELTPAFVRLTHMSRLEVAPGRFVRCWSVLRPPPRPTLSGDYDFERQAHFRKLGAVGYVQGRCRGGAVGPPKNVLSKVEVRIGAFRHQLARRVYEAAGPEAGGFASAVVSGDRSYLSQTVQDDLRSSGLAHLLAISGLHMGLVGGLVFFIVHRCLVLVEYVALRVAVQKPAAVVALVASLAYLIVSGGSVSTQRAFIMSAVVFGALLFDRSAISLRTFAIAMILVVLLQPESVVTPGFQMSFAASGGLIVTYEAWNARRAKAERPLGKISFFLASLFVTSAVATFATAPFAIFHFGRTAPLSIVANLFAMPVITFVSAPLAALSMIASPFGLSEFPLRWFGQSLAWVQRIAAYLSDFDFENSGISKQMPVGALWCLVVGMLFAGISRGIWRGVGAGGMLIAASFVWWLSPTVVFHWSKSGDVFVSPTGDGWMMKIPIEDGEALPPLGFADAPLLSLKGFSAPLRLDWGMMRLEQSSNDSVAHIELPSGEAYAVTWPDVQTSDGVTASLTHGKRLQFHTMACHTRPWRNCNRED